MNRDKALSKLNEPDTDSSDDEEEDDDLTDLEKVTQTEALLQLTEDGGDEEEDEDEDEDENNEAQAVDVQMDSGCLRTCFSSPDGEQWLTYGPREAGKQNNSHSGN